jgi:hypothetical protein
VWPGYVRLCDLLPAISATRSTNWLMVTVSSDPILTRSGDEIEVWVIVNRHGRSFIS